MIDILKDDCDKLVIPKASKIGVSELLFIDLFVYAMQGKNGMYVLPTDSVKNRLVSTRIDPITTHTKLYKAASTRKATDSKSLKTIFGSQWNFVGSKSTDAFYEFDADVMIYDEFDRCDHANLALAADRTGAAAQEVWRKIGNPSIVGYGIWAEFEKSDMRQWLIKCEHCGESQRLDWFTNFARREDSGSWVLRDPAFFSVGNHADLLSRIASGGGDAKPVCSRCEKTFDRLGPGEWVAEHPDRGVHGYAACRLFGAPGNDGGAQRPIILETMDYWLDAQNNATNLQVFYNNRLGLPFENEGSKITMSLLAECEIEEDMPNGATDTVAGMDVGSRLHLHISRITSGGKRRKVFVGHALDWTDAERICKDYDVTRGVVDAAPELHAAKDWCNNHSGWYRCLYSKSDTAKTLMDIDHVKKVVNVNRTSSIDQTFAEWRNKEVELCRGWRQFDNGDFVKQMLAPTRVLNEERLRYEWQEGSQPDHHFHADNYERIASSMIASGSLVQIL